MAQTESFVSTRRAIYPPAVFPSLRKTQPESSIRENPKSDFHGRLSPAEAAAVLVLLTESSALCQAFAESWDTARKIDELLGISGDLWQSDVIEGFSSFGNMLGLAAGVRESEEIIGKIKTIGDKIKKDWWDKFHGAIEQDGKILGRATASAIERTVGEFAERDIPNNPEGARNNEEIRTRIASQKRGAQLARKLYLETFSLTSRQLPTQP